MGSSNLIALLSFFIAVLAAIYARRAITQARNANEISIQAELKPRRLSVYANVKEFLHFCSIYKTMQHLKMVQGTNDLSNKIDTFMWKVEQQGPLDMPEVENLIENARKRALQLQRLLDRLNRPDAKPIEKEFKTAEDNVDAIIEWFAAKKKELKNLFEPYLRITQ